MIDSTQTLKYKLSGFSNNKYLLLQKEKILERIDKFRNGKLYLEIGGKFLYDPHAARVLPGFQPDIKKEIFLELRNISEIIFNCNGDDILSNRQLQSSQKDYTQYVSEKVNVLNSELGIKPQIVINLVDPTNIEKCTQFKESLNNLGYTVHFRYKIKDYPNNLKLILSKEGFGKDELVETNKKLVLVTGAASNSGKMSTCLGQIYGDVQNGLNSGYAKFETFPIWSLPINHPVNLAYEAATADIGDYNMIDTYHMESYGQRSVNYNRDVDAFKIIKQLTDQFLSQDNYVTQYKSPTDMGINYAGSAIENDHIVCVASLEEIRRRAEWFTQQQKRGDGKQEWINKCIKLERQALNYMAEQRYSTDLNLF